MTRLRYNAITHVGKVRQINEDSIIALEDQKIWVVADGMGGHSGGDFASQTVVDCVAMIPLDLEPAQSMHALRDALMDAHAHILAEIAARGVTTIMISGENFVCFWAGDCRLYRLREGQIELLTSDHSLVAELVHAGQLSWDEAEHHPQSNAITRAVGVGDTLELEKIRGTIQSGDRFLLCSDGLNKYAGFDLLRRTLAQGGIENISNTLLNIALEGGGADNISIIVVDVI